MTALLDLARAVGFEAAAPLRAEQLVFRPEVREMCRADRCRRAAADQRPSDRAPPRPEPADPRRARRD